MCVVGVERTWDLRSYTADGLALLTGRKRAYGYYYTEAFLSQLAEAEGSQRWTDALAHWTTELWHSSEESSASKTALTCYIDGHRKPVYTDSCLPRGLVGRLGTILGCRALVLLHDEQGHPLLATTHRGDQHLITGLPSIIERYENSEVLTQVKRIIVDREGMATEFLAALQADGRTVVTILRTNQYRDLTSFSEVGAFVPLTVDPHGQVLREVAPARMVLKRPDHPGEVLSLHVALIRDLHRQVPVQPNPEDEEIPHRWDADRKPDDPRWWEEGWQATAAPAKKTTAKLIPIVTTASSLDAVELAQSYIRRWPVQENVIKDYLLPLGLDINHGYGKTQVPNSEVTKQRTRLRKRLARLKKWAQGAGKRAVQASQRHDRFCQQLTRRSDELERELGLYQSTLESQGDADHILQREIKARKAVIDLELEQIRTKERRASEQRNNEFRKQERYCQAQRHVLSALEDLDAKERTMYELDNRKDQVMTVCKLAMANLAMWVRDHYFPPSYAHATWLRLAPFFRLPGTIVSDATTTRVELRPFNDRALNRDLTSLCERVNQASPQLPDGRCLCFSLAVPCRILPASDRLVT
jgi:hypothetical protein